MRILHLASFLQGGAGRVISDLAIAQAKGGHDVAVVTSRTGVAGYGNYPQYLDDLSAGHIATHQIDSLFHRDAAANLAVVQALVELSGPHGPDVIHAHAAVPGLIGLMFAGIRRRDVRIVQTMHGWGVNKDADQSAADVAIMSLVDRVATPSLHAAGLLVRLGVDPSNITTVPYGVRPKGPQPSADDDHLLIQMARARRRGSFVVACVGTIGARKNQALLVQAAAMMKARAAGKASGIFLVVVGDGDVAPLKEIARQAGITDDVRLHGYSAAARRIGAAADLLVLPSQSEGQPLAVLEAFCDDVLVATSDIPELRELVQDGLTGLSFTANDVSALADMLAAAIALPAPARRAMRNRARERVAAFHTVPVMASAYETLYRAPARDTARRTSPRLFSAA